LFGIWFLTPLSQFKGTMVRLTGDVRLKLGEEYDEKYIFGNPVRNGILN
jgi:hypothetical protein